MGELDDMIAEDTEDLLPEMTGVPSLPGTLGKCFDHADVRFASIFFRSVYPRGRGLRARMTCGVIFLTITLCFSTES